MSFIGFIAYYISCLDKRLAEHKIPFKFFVLILIRLKLEFLKNILIVVYFGCDFTKK
jgi:hypothetical protein